MELAGYRRGDRDALVAVMDHVGPWVWALTRRGFVCRDALVLGDEPSLLRVPGTENDDRAAQLTEAILCAAMGSREREGMETCTDIEARVLECARRVLFRAAERAGRLERHESHGANGTVLEDIDHLLQTGERPSLEAPPHRFELPRGTWAHLRERVLRRLEATTTRRSGPRRALIGTAAGLAVLGTATLLANLEPSAQGEGSSPSRIEVRCQPACFAGATAHVAILAPPGATRFAVLLRHSGAGHVEPWLTAPGGETTPLPEGAKRRLLTVPRALRVPKRLGSDTLALAVFSARPLTAATLRAIGLGGQLPKGVSVTTSAIVP